MWWLIGYAVGCFLCLPAAVIHNFEKASPKDSTGIKIWASFVCVLLWPVALWSRVSGILFGIRS